MNSVTETLSGAAAEQQADQAKLGRIAANLADISEVAASRVTQRIEARMRKRGSYIGQLVSTLRQEREELTEKIAHCQKVIDAERDNVDEVRLLRRLDEITREDSESRVESARAAVRAIREELRAFEARLSLIDDALSPYSEETEQ